MVSDVDSLSNSEVDEGKERESTGADVGKGTKGKRGANRTDEETRMNHGRFGQGFDRNGMTETVERFAHDRKVLVITWGDRVDETAVRFAHDRNVWNS